MMAITGIPREMVEEECIKMSEMGYQVFISNYNSPLQTVISGYKEPVQKIGALLVQKGAKAIPLKVSAPFHSPIMQSAADRLGEELYKYDFKPLKWPVISNVTGLPHIDQADIINSLKSQMVSPVRWQETMEFMNKQGITHAIEIGPKTVLKGLVEKNTPGIIAFSYDVSEDVKTLKKEVAESRDISNKSKAFKHTVVTKCIEIAVTTRNRNWDNDEYQKGVVEKYREIQHMQAEIEKEGKEPTVDMMKKALDMLASVFATKRVPVSEQKERYDELFEATGTKELFPNFDMFK
jgi:[acyl-carrier-protein] S-malonyltransferase